MPTQNVTDRGRIHLGLDVAKNSIAVAILRPDEVEPDTEKIGHDEVSIRRLIARFDDPGDLVACYEAGPTGYDLHRLLTSIGVRADVVAPSLIPKAPGDRVKPIAATPDGSHACIAPASSPRSVCRASPKKESATCPRPPGRRRGSTAGPPAPRVVPPAPQRDLSRTDGVDGEARGVDQVPSLRRPGDQERVRLLPRRSRRTGRDVVGDHRRARPLLRQSTLRRTRAPPRRLPGDRLPRCAHDRLRGLRLPAIRGRWRVHGFSGLVPSEYSTGESVSRGHITHAGNVHVRTQLVESAWAYQHSPARGVRIIRRQEGLPPETIERSWRAQVRLCGRFRRLAQRKDSRNTVVTAIARETRGVRLRGDDCLRCALFSGHLADRRPRCPAFTGRASHPPSQARSPFTFCSPATPAAFQVRGHFLRIHTLRFRPADMRVAEAHPTIGCASGEHRSQAATGATRGNDVAAVTRVKVVRPRFAAGAPP